MPVSSSGSLEPRQDPPRQVRVVPAIAGQDDVGLGRRLVEHVPPDRRDAAAVGVGVQPDRRDRERIDVRGRRRRGPGRIAAIAQSPEPAARSKTRRSGHDLWMLLQVPADREPAAPGERPERDRRVGIVGLELRRTPQRVGRRRPGAAGSSQVRGRARAGSGGGRTLVPPTASGVRRSRAQPPWASLARFTAWR